jgi:hypothetical protein
MSSLPASVTPFLVPSVAYLRLSEAIAALAPAADSIDTDTRKRTLDLLRNAPGMDVDAATLYGRAYPQTLERVLALLSNLRATMVAGSPTADLLDREIQVLLQEQSALGRLHEAFFRGHVIVLGIKKGAADRQHHPIPPSYFSKRRALCWRSNEIRESALALVKDHTRAARDYEFDDVLVDGPSFALWSQGAPVPNNQASATAASPKKVSPSQNAVAKAAAALWPGGIPNSLKAKDRNDQIRNWCLQNGHSQKALPSRRTIVRALKSPH